jgi:hypothetical protein
VRYLVVSWRIQPIRFKALAFSCVLGLLYLRWKTLGANVVYIEELSCVILGLLYLKVEGRELERVMIVKLLEAIANSLDQVIILLCVLCFVLIGYVN